VIDGYAPRSLANALELLSVHPGATLVAGGTDLMVEINRGRLRPDALIDLSQVEELTQWRCDGDTVFVGAGVTFDRIVRELAEFPALAQAARSVGSPEIRKRATIGGNLATASPAGDGIVVLAAYDADVVVSAHGRDTLRIPWRRFFTAPKRTVLEPDELIVGVEWRATAGPDAFAKVGIRNAMTIAVASVCLKLDEQAHSVRIGLGSVGPTVLRAAQAEELAAACEWDDPGAALIELGRQAAAEAQPIDDLRGSEAYRRRVVEVMTRRAFVWALEDRC
jgi:CO/xanthine dehydrogenase FAD-binding subunit